MLITFKSPAGGEVMMFEKNARELVGVLGKEGDAARGIVTVEQLPAAIAALEIAMEADHEKPAVLERHSADDEEKRDEVVGFYQRAVPLRELLERSLKDKVPVTWGV